MTTTTEERLTIVQIKIPANELVMLGLPVLPEDEVRNSIRLLGWPLASELGAQCGRGVTVAVSPQRAMGKNEGDESKLVPTDFIAFRFAFAVHTPNDPVDPEVGAKIAIDRLVVATRSVRSPNFSGAFVLDCPQKYSTPEELVPNISAIWEAVQHRIINHVSLAAREISGRYRKRVKPDAANRVEAPEVAALEIPPYDPQI